MTTYARHAFHSSLAEAALDAAVEIDALRRNVERSSGSVEALFGLMEEAVAAAREGDSTSITSLHDIYLAALRSSGTEPKTVTDLVAVILDWISFSKTSVGCMSSAGLARLLVEVLDIHSFALADMHRAAMEQRRGLAA